MNPPKSLKGLQCLILGNVLLKIYYEKGFFKMKITKRLMVFLLSFAMLMTPMHVFAENTAPKGTTLPFAHVPIRNSAEISGAEVGYENGSIIIKYKNDIYKYKANSSEGEKNNEAITLNAPVMIENGIAYADYEDLKYLFVSEGDLYPNAKKEIITTTYYLMKAYDVPSFNYAFTDTENNYVWQRSFGYSDVENKIPANTSNVYGLASISKVFTAISIMQLAEEGKISLDDKVIKYLPELKIDPHPVYGGDYEDITIRMLLAHVSGIPSDNFSDIYTKDSYNQDYMNKFIETINTQYMDNKPLFRWYYANNGYTALGIVVAKVSGYENYFEGFNDYVQKNIFDKMSMKDSTFIVNENTMQKLAAPYISASTGKQEYNLFMNPIPAGGLYSNSGDIVKLMNMFLNNGTYEGNEIISPISLSLMTNPSGYDMQFNPEINMGLGLYSSTVDGIRMVGHGGDVANYHSDMQMSLENKIGVFGTGSSHTSMGVSGSITALSMQWLVNEKLGKEAQEETGSEPNIIELSREELAKYEGHYTVLGKVYVTDENELMFSALGITVKPTEKGYFYSDILGYFSFGNIKGMDVVYLGTTVLAEKIEPMEADESILKWVGTYTEENLKQNSEPIVAKISVYLTEDNYSAFSFTSNVGSESKDMLIDKISDDMYYILGTSRNYGKVLRFYEENGKKHLDAFGIKMVCVD